MDSPMSGAVLVPFRYAQSKAFVFGSPTMNRPTQSLGLAGPPVTLIVMLSPGATVDGVAVTAGVSAPWVKEPVPACGGDEQPSIITAARTTSVWLRPFMRV